MANWTPESRVEEILYDTINGEEYTGLPESRIEELLLELKEVIEAGGGGGGGTVVIANPSGPATDDLIKIKVGSTIYGIDAGALSAQLKASVSVGGISSGKTYSAGTSIETILRDLLNPVLYPTLTNPSASISAPGDKLLETGATASKTFTVSFNRGSINPAYGTSGYRSGAATGYSLNGGASQQSNEFTQTVSSSNKTFKAAVSYEAGEQPKDSSGANYSTPLAAGSVESNTITYEFVDAIWANTSNIASIAKLAIVSKSAGQKDMNFPAQTVANPETFDIPASWTVTAVQVKNDLSGQWEDAASQFTISDVNHDNAAGTSVAYKRYTFNLGYDTGARSVRVKWS